MAWFSRFTRFLDAHLVYSQEAENSCGIACTLMVVFKLNKLTPGKQALYAEKEIYDAYGKESGSTYDGSAYTYTNHLAATLCKLNVGNWAQANLPVNDVPEAIADTVGVKGIGPKLTYDTGKAPIIVLVGWTGGGAHFVVIDSVVETGGKKYATVCDPWDGNVHVTELKYNQPFDYVGARVPWSWQLGGKRHQYETPNPGTASGWVVWRW